MKKVLWLLVALALLSRTTWAVPDDGCGTQCVQTGLDAVLDREALPGPVVATGDFNGDGIEDVIVVEPSGLQLWLGDAQGHFRRAAPFPKARDPFQGCPCGLMCTALCLDPKGYYCCGPIGCAECPSGPQDSKFTVINGVCDPSLCPSYYAPCTSECAGRCTLIYDPCCNVIYVACVP